MEICLTKLNAQGWNSLFLQGEPQQKFRKMRCISFTQTGLNVVNFFLSTVRRVSINLVADDLAKILNIRMGGWGHYVKFKWTSLDNLASALDISRKFSENPHLLLL